MIEKIKKYIFSSLKREFFVSIAFVYTLLAFILMLFIILHEYSTITKKTIQRSQTYAKLIARISIEEVLTFNLNSIAEIISTSKELEGVTRVTIVNRHGKVLGDSKSENIGKFLSDENSIDLLRLFYNSKPIQKPITYFYSNNLIESNWPIIVNDNYIGWARVYISTNTIKEEIFNFATIIFTIFSISIILGSFTIYWTTDKVTKKLNILTNEVSAFEIGEKVPQIGNISQDEIGILSNRLQFFMEKLNQNFTEILTFKNDLEKLVYERTEELNNTLSDLKETNFFINQMINYFPLGVLLYDYNGKCLYTNNRVPEILGATDTSKILAQNYNNIESWKKSGLLEQVKKVEDTKQFVKYLTEVETSFDKKITIDCFLIPITQKGKDILLMAINDITKEKLYEKSLEKSNMELEQFAYVAAHDLSEPIRSIESFAELLKSEFKEDLPKNANLYFHHISTSTERMQRLIHDLLDFSKVSSTLINLKSVNISQIIQIAKENLFALITKSNAEIIDDVDLSYTCDPGLLSQLFQNLIKNAIIYSKKDSKPIIKISAFKNDKDIVISIKDNGIGISKKHYNDIFVIFKRLHSRDKYPGSGIGLSVCSKIVDKHNGRIWLESEEGNGTTFFIALPIK